MALEYLHQPGQHGMKQNLLKAVTADDAADDDADDWGRNRFRELKKQVIGWRRL